MRAMCIDTQGEESIQRLSIVNLEDIDISSVSRFGKDINVSELDQQEILAKVRQLDLVIDNYCHGMYIVLD